MNMTQNQYWIWFSSINLLPIKKYRLFKIFKTVNAIYEAKQSELLKIEDINMLDVFEIEKSKNYDLIKKYENYINKNEITIININDKHYPEKLKNIYDPPVVLFAKGNLELLNQNGLAIVGSRNATEYGLKQSYTMAYNLSKSGLAIISGLAKGVDKMAHLGAINSKGKTIAIIGCGLDIIYPKENYEVYQKIFNEGLIISEYIVGTRPMPENFPMRNRIISALSDGVLLIEARKRSGAMITIDFALEYGKNVYAVPGNLDNELSEGCNFLIQEGAKMVTNYKDILEDYVKIY